MQTKSLTKHDEVQHQLADYLWENIPGLEALLIITREGDVIEHRTVPKYQNAYTIQWFKNFGNLISERFTMKDFHKHLGGLDMTVNIFKDKAVLVSLIVIRPSHSSSFSSQRSRKTQVVCPGSTWPLADRSAESTVT